jgi:hypothetical protein
VRGSRKVSEKPHENREIGRLTRITKSWEARKTKKIVL